MDTGTNRYQPPAPPISPIPPPPFPTPLSTPPYSPHVKTLLTNETCENIIFAALNISGGKISSKKTEIELFAKSTDIFVLTEAFFEDKKVFLKDRFIYSSFLNNGRGIVVIIDRKMKILEKDCIVEGRGIYIKVEYNKKTYDIIAIYAPAEASDATSTDFYSRIHKYMNDNSLSENIILLGDANLDLSKVKKRNSRIVLEQIIDEFNLNDTGKYCHTGEMLPTWTGSGLRGNQCSRIDIILTNLNIKNISYEQRASTGDHDYIFIKYKSDIKNVLNTVRCKDSVLMDPEFSNKAKNFIRDFLLLNSDQNTESTSILENISELNITDQIKKLDSILTFKDLELQELTILDLILKKTKTIHDEVSRKKNKEEHNTIRRIQAKIQKLKKVVTEDKSELNLEKLKEAKVELKDFYYTKKLGNEAKIEEFVILKDGEINANLFNEIKEKKF